MAVFWKSIAVFVVAYLLDIVASTKHVKREQVILSSSFNPKLKKARHGAEGSVMVEVNFDGINLTSVTNHTLDAVPFVEFQRFQVMNSTAAMDKGFLNETDMDCAASSPNFIVSLPSEYAAPSIFHTTDEILEAAGVSKYVDLISFTVKPLRSNLTGVFGGVDIAAWELDGKHANNVHSLYLGFSQKDDGAFNAFPIVPREYFAGWGEKVNWIEMSAYTMDDDYVITPSEFCLDDIIVEIREKRGDE